MTNGPAATRPRILGVDFPALAQLAVRLGYRATRNRHPLESPGIQVVLETKVARRQTGPSTHTM